MMLSCYSIYHVLTRQKETALPIMPAILAAIPTIFQTSVVQNAAIITPATESSTRKTVINIDLPNFISSII